MAKKPGKLRVQLSASATATLEHIWNWNAEHYGAEHADGYIKFLRDEVNDLCMDSSSSRGVPTLPGFRYITIRKRRAGHGHVAVFRVVGNTVEVMDFFHTAQDWQVQVDRFGP